MQLQFERTSISCLHRVAREIKDQEQTHEIRIPDGMPDIGKILGCWGQVLIRSKEWRNTGICVNGGIMTWVLYAPEEGAGERCLDAWIPFQVKCDFDDNERDGGILVQPLLRSIDARTVSARKLMVRADINLLCDALTDGEIEVHTPCDVPEDIHLLEHKYSVLLPKETNEKAFSVDETFAMHTSMRPIDKIIYYHVSPSLAEQKVMGDKVIFRGTMGLHALVSSEDGEIFGCDFEFPFSQYAELGMDYSTNASAQTIMNVTSLELDKTDEENYRLRVGLTGQYVVYDQADVTVIEDAYSTKRDVAVTVNPLQLPSVLDMRKDNINAEIKMQDGYSRLIDAMFYPDCPKTYHDGDKAITEYGGIFRILAIDPEGEVSGLTERWDSVSSVDADASTRPMVTVSDPMKALSVNSGLEQQLTAELRTETVWIAGDSLPMLTGIESGECQMPDPDRPGIVLKRVGEATLWELAKETGSTVDLIVDANGLVSPPDPSQILLIPVV